MAKQSEKNGAAGADEIREMVCIVCPIGCRLKAEVRPAEEELAVSTASTTPAAPEVRVSGNKCPRGETYAVEEILAPKRTVTATCRVTGHPWLRRVPVKTSAALPVEHIDDLLAQLYTLHLEAPVTLGHIVLEDFAGTGIDVLTSRSVEAR